MRHTFRLGFLLFAIFLLAITFSAHTRASNGKGANPPSSFGNFIGGGFMVSSAPAVTPSSVVFTPQENSSFTGTVANFTTSNGLATASSFSATIDWGDGTTTAGTVTGGSGSFSVSGSHTYAEDGSFTVPVTIHDNTDNSNAIVNSTANVSEGFFIISAGNAINAVEGVPVNNFQVATFSDSLPTSPDTASAFTATIDWGDGTTTAGTVAGSNGNFTVTGSHTYTEELSGAGYLVTVSEPSANFTLGPVGAPVTVTEGDALTPQPRTFGATKGQQFSGNVASFTDSLTSTPANDFTSTIDWGDGTTTTGIVSGGSGSFNVSGTHTYANTGTFNLHVALTDDAPGTATATANSTANVTNPVGPWTAAGSTGTVDEDSQSIVSLNNFAVGLLPGQTGSVHIRYNITATPSLTAFCAPGQSKISVRFRNSDNTGNTARVTFTIFSSSVAGGGINPLFTFSSDGLGSGNGFTTKNFTPNIIFDHNTNIYWIEATIFKSDPNQFANLGSIQITEISGAACP